MAIDGDFTLNYGTELHVRALGTILRDAKENPIGALVVLNDVFLYSALLSSISSFSFYGPHIYAGHLPEKTN